MELAPVQAEKGPKGRLLVPAGFIEWGEHLEAWQAYSKLYPGQSAEQIAVAGGFGWNELVRYLTRAPRTWRPRDPKLAEEYEPPAGKVGL